MVVPGNFLGEAGGEPAGAGDVARLGGPSDLKANQNFLQLQRELTDTEEKIAYARQFYNRNVLSYNQTTVSTFPTVVIANMFGFQPEEFFEAEEEAREDVHVSFGHADAGARRRPHRPPARTARRRLPGHGLAAGSQPKVEEAQQPVLIYDRIARTGARRSR